MAYTIGDPASTPPDYQIILHKATAFDLPSGADHWGCGYKSSDNTMYFFNSTTEYQVFHNRNHLYPASDGYYYVGSASYRMAGVYAYQGVFTYSDAATTTVTNAATIGHNSSATPAAGFGTGLVWQGKTSTTNNTNMGRIRSAWATATDGSQKSKMIISAYDTSERDGITIEASGTAVMLGFFGATAVVKPTAYTQTYSTADKTLSAYTPDDESAAYTGIDNAQVGTVYAKLTDLNALRTAVENLRTFAQDTAQMLNSVVDDLQSLGLVG